MPALETSALYSARPRLLLGGRDNTRLSDGLLSLLVTETTAGLYRCEATFGNWGADGGGPDFLYFDRAELDFGKKLAVVAGDGEAEAEIFSGRILGLEGQFPGGRPPAVVVLAEDRFQDLRMTRRTRAFEDVSDADVLQRVASQHGLKADVDVDGPTHRVLAQVNQSDLAFLRARARAIDAELWIEGDTLHAQARSRRRAGEVTLAYGFTLRELSVTADLAGQRTSLTVSGWDVAGKEAIRHEADESAVRGELGRDLGGATLLKEALGERPERVVHTVPLTQQEVKAEAEARYRSLARRFLTGEGVAEGDGRIRVGTHVELTRLGPLFDGKYYVSAVEHAFDGREGYRTRFTVERPGLGRR